MNEGTIFTFYSYKGGVGRTFALANIGALLSLWGYKTLCVDWDLEAPGLHLYFQQWINGGERRGLIEMIQDHAEGKNPHWRDYVTKVNVPDAKQPLLLMSAGLQDTSYVQRMQELNWANLYENFNLGNFLEEMREDWKESLDVVLIDSRTGITDIGGICTVQFPDVLVLLFTANNQSLYGSIDVVERARRARAHLPVDRAKILVLPIVARFEGRVEVELAASWLKTFEKELGSFYTEWSHRDTTIPDLLNFTRIPYIPYWSFGEKLPVIEKGTKDPDDIGFPLETLAALVAQHLCYSEILVRNRDTFVTTAKQEPISILLNREKEETAKPGRPLRVLISYAHEDKVFLNELEKHLSPLKRQGWLMDWYESSIELGSRWQEEFRLRLEEADIILLLISSDYVASDFLYSVEMMHALELHDAGQVTIIPIISRPTLWEDSPIGNLQALPTDGRAITSSSWYTMDEALLDVMLGIQKVIEVLRTQPSPLSSIRVWNIPYLRNPMFTGREEVLNALHNALQLGKRAALTQPHVISGLGGIGKTQTAVEYAYRYRKDYRIMLWVKADSRETLNAELAAIAKLLNLPEQDARDQTLAIKAALQWLTEQTEWLLILDNADDLTLVSDILSTIPGGHILLTTRAHAIGNMAQRIVLDTMEPEEGVLFLLQRANLIALKAPLTLVSEVDRAKAEAIVKAIDGLPLALDQAGAYIEETKSSLAGYLNLYRERRTTLLQRRGGPAADYPKSVVTTCALSFMKVEQTNSLASELLRFCAFLYPDDIPEELITENAAILGSTFQAIGADPLVLNGVITELLNYSLIRRDSRKGTLSLHRLVQAVLSDEMDSKTQRRWAERAVRAVNQSFPSIEAKTWDACQTYLPHALECASHIARWNMTFAEAASLVSQAGLYLIERAQYEQAEPLLQQALRIYEEVLGPEHPDTARTLNSLAILYQNQGKYEQAEPFYQRALWTRERMLGNEHLDTADTLNGLAILYQNQGKYEQAEPLYLRALWIYEQLLGPEHLDTARTLNNLATLYTNQGKFEEAETLYRRTLAIREQVLGPEYPDTARTLNSLANLYVDQAKYSQAREAYEKALEISKQQGDLRQQGVVLGQLGTLALQQRNYAEAQSRYETALQLFQTFGEPEVEAVAWHQLGRVAQEQREWAKAERCYRESLSIEERLGNTTGAARTCNQLAIVSQGVGRPSEAEGWYMRGLELYEQTNPGGPESARTLSNLANLLVDEVQAGRAATTRLAEAQRYARQALTIDETLDASMEIWQDFAILAEIADLEGYVEEVRDYRRRERETYAAFAGNRYHIDQQHGPLIAAIAAAAQGDTQAQEAIEAALPQLEEKGWKIAAPTRRIWSGERDWDALVEDVDSQNALLILRVLETIAQPIEESAPSAPEKVFAALPSDIREALEQGDEAAFERALEALSPEEQQKVLAAIQYLQAQVGEENGQEE